MLVRVSQSKSFPNAVASGSLQRANTGQCVIDDRAGRVAFDWFADEGQCQQQKAVDVDVLVVVGGNHWQDSRYSLMAEASADP